MSTNIDDLQPEVQAKARSFLSLLTIPYVVTSTLRTTEEQMAYYAQGRAPLVIVNLLRKHAGMKSIADGENQGTITNCDGVNTLSNHQGGRALDVVPADEKGNPIWPHIADPRWQRIAVFGESVGFEWGGRWKEFPDMPHYELKA